MNRYRVNEALVAWSMADGEAIVVHTETTDYFSINQSGTWIWTLLAEQPCSRDDVIRLLATRYGRPETEAASEVAEFFAQLADAQLLLSVDELAAAPAAQRGVAESPGSYYEPPQLVQFGHLETLILSGE